MQIAYYRAKVVALWVEGSRAVASTHPSISCRLDRTPGPVVSSIENLVMRIKLCLIIAIGVLLAYSGLIEPYWISERSYEVSIRGLGPEPLTIVHIADVHAARFGLRERMTLERINRLRPDYIFIAGDLIKGKGDTRGALRFLSGLRARYGVYSVGGNADGDLLAALKADPSLEASAGWRMLINEHVDCGTFTLVGVDDPVSHRENMYRAFRNVPPSKPVFVLTHFHPDSLLSEFEYRGVDLVFSGHTHGGQTSLVPLIGLVPYAYRSRFIYGLYTIRQLRLVVTRGIGTSIFPFRFLCRPEIVIMKLTG